MRRRVGEFIVPGATSVEGVYGNADVEMMVATYCVPTDLGSLESVEANVRARGWRLREKTGEGMLFDRQSGRSYELVEVRRVPETPYLALSWVRTFEGGDAPYGSDQIMRGRGVTGRVMNVTINRMHDIKTR